MTFDLDPGEGVAVGAHAGGGAAGAARCSTSWACRRFLKTSGGKGLHVVVPLKRRYDWDTVKDFSQAVVAAPGARRIPDRFVAKSGPRNRVGKIFVDYLRNGFGATTVCAWSARARPGLGVSVPLAWDELPTLTSASQWTVRNIARRMPTGNTPWEAMEKSRKAIGAAMKMLGYAPGRTREVRQAAAGSTSAVVTAKRSSVLTPNTIVIGTSAASRPRAITTRPMRGMLWRASKVCQRSPR